MIILGIVLLVVGYWLLPALFPVVPAVIDSIAVGLGWFFLIVGLIVFLLSVFGGKTFGGRRYWY